MKNKILVMGLSGNGKTYISRLLEKYLNNSIHLNGDHLRSTISSDLDFSENSRIEHARRIYWMSTIVLEKFDNVIIDIICPIKKMRELIQPNVIFWMNTKKYSKFENTDKIFDFSPQIKELLKDEKNYKIYKNEENITIFEIIDFQYDFNEILSDFKRYIFLNQDNDKEKISENDLFDMKQNTALLIGRYQPFHEGHYRLSLKALEEVGAICFGIRETYGLEKNPYSFEIVKNNIIEYFNKNEVKWDNKRMKIIRLPNITDVCYGRDVGYKIRKIDLDENLEKISATKIREKFL